MPNRFEIPDLFDGDLTWLGSSHGADQAATGKILLSAFSSLDTNGYIPSGIPLAYAADASGDLVPYVSGAADSTGVLVGFLLTNQATMYRYIATTDDHLNVAYLYHGRVITANLPVAFTAPDAAHDKTNVVFA